MEAFFQAISLELENLTQLVPGGATTISLGLIFLAVFFAVIAIGSFLGNRGSVERRLAGHASKAVSSADSDIPTLRANIDRDGSWDQILKPLEKYFVDQKEGAQSSLRQRMLMAGFVGPNVVRNYFLARTLLAVGLPGVFLILSPTIAGDMSVKKLIVVTAGLALAGLYIPGIWISSRVDRRKQAITEAFPDALDMMVVCVEAGLGMDAAFTRVGAQIAQAHPVLAQELGLVALELRAGKTREEALRNFGKRCGLKEINSFVTLLIQSDQLGTSVAQTLRVYAQEMRTARMLRAEEKAHKLPVKLVVPLVTCILPAMMAAVLLPDMITIIRVIIPNLGS